MRTGIMQPYFFPYIGYWQLLNAVDNYVIYDDVNFIKGGWINRNRILVNNKPSYINLKMSGASSNRMINEIYVSNDLIYRNKLLRTIEQSYKKAPYFEVVFPLIEEIILCKEEKLSLYLKNSIEKVAQYLGIKTELIMSSSIKKNNCSRGQEKVIDICKILGSKEYYNAIGGQELYSSEDFDSSGIKLYFVQTESIKYKQYGEEFIPHLSIIDTMMFNSLDEMKKLLNQYKCI